MDRVSGEDGLIQFPQYATDFGLIDFTHEANFDQFIDLIRGDENEHQYEPIFNYHNQGYAYNHHQNSINVDSYSLPVAPPPPPLEFFDSNGDFGFVNACQNRVNEEAEEEDEEEGSSGSGTGTGTTATNNEASKKSSNKADRSRTLISERKRRSRMKEKLYALRALVPNITKMDKASIVGDAVLYVQDLQMQAKKLQAEIASLESIQDKTSQNSKKMNLFYPMIKKILQIEVFQVEERGFYVKVVADKGKGVGMLLYRALESLITFDVRSSNLAVSADNYVFTFTLHTMEGAMDVSLQNMKLWIATVFLNQGFEFQTSSLSA